MRKSSISVSRTATHPVASIAVTTTWLVAGVFASPLWAQGDDVAWKEKRERVVNFSELVPDHGKSLVTPKVQLERVSSGVPWPRGLALVDGDLVVLARGRHRRSGGIDSAVHDLSGNLMRVDPAVAEPVVLGELASDAIRGNASLLAAPKSGPFRLWDKKANPKSDFAMDRPYCTLIFDKSSRNLFICGFSGVDLPGARFRKNASDSIHRYDLRTSDWYPVEMHDHTIVPEDPERYTVPSKYFPHHDPAKNAPPHGWVNGPNGGCVAGEFLYVVAKDNHALVQYDLAEVRKSPKAGPPQSRLLMGAKAQLTWPGGEGETELLGASAAEYHDGFLYVGYRTSSVVVRFPTGENGDLVRPIRGELIAVFEPWRQETKRSANLIDLAFDSKGALYVSCAREGRVWRVGNPDPKAPFYGDDQSKRPTTALPYVDIATFTGTQAGCGNILFDDQDRLYVCAGNYDSGTKLAGAIYRASQTD